MCHRPIFLNQFVRIGLALLMLLAAPTAHAGDAGRLPDDQQIQAALEKAYAASADNRDGALPDYIPALTRVDADRFGIAIATADGKVFSIGDSEQAFAIMSIAKVFTLAWIIETLGADTVQKRIGVEPTGFPFNSVLAIELNPARSINPLVNAGAMAAVSLLPGDNDKQRWQLLLAFYERLAGSPLSLNQEAYDSVSAGGYRNRAIADLLWHYQRLYNKPASVLDIYNRQSSVNVSASQLARMGATLANHGKTPLTNQVIMKPDTVPPVTSVMLSAGLYETSGDWSYEVGVPAKSGVGGGILAVVPGKLAIAAFSPRLDDAGNSVRGQLAIRSLVRSLQLDLFDQ